MRLTALPTLVRKWQFSTVNRQLQSQPRGIGIFVTFWPCYIWAWKTRSIKMWRVNTDLVSIALAHIACKIRSSHYSLHAFRLCAQMSLCRAGSCLFIRAGLGEGEDGNEKAEFSADMTRLTFKPPIRLGLMAYQEWSNAKLKSQHTLSNNCAMRCPSAISINPGRRG